MRRWAVLVATLGVIAAFALAIVDRGGSSAEARFVDQVCSTALPRALEMLDTYDDVNATRAAPGADARGLLLAYALRAKEIARKFSAEIRALRAPETDEGRRAEDLLDLFAGFAAATIADEERRLRKLPQSITLVQSIRGLDRLERSVIHTYAFMTDTRVMASQTGMLETYEKTEACKELDLLDEERT